MTSMQQQLASDVPVMLAFIICGAVGYLVTRLIKPRIMPNVHQRQKLLAHDDEDAVAPIVTRSAQTRKRSRRDAKAKAEDSTLVPVACGNEEQALPTSQTSLEESMRTRLLKQSSFIPSEEDVLAHASSAVDVSTRVDKIMAKKALRKARKLQESKAEGEQLVDHDEDLMPSVIKDVMSAVDVRAASETSPDVLAVNKLAELPSDYCVDVTLGLCHTVLEQETLVTDSASVPSDDLDTSCPSTCEMQVEADVMLPKIESEDEQIWSEETLASAADAEPSLEEQRNLTLEDAKETTDGLGAENQPALLSGDVVEVGQWAVYDSDDEKELAVEYSHVNLGDEMEYAEGDGAREEERQGQRYNVEHPLVVESCQLSLPRVVENENEIREAWGASHCNDSTRKILKLEATIWDAPHWKGPSRQSPALGDGWMLPLDDVLAGQAMAQAHPTFMPRTGSWDGHDESLMCEMAESMLDLGPSLQHILSEFCHAPADADAGLIYMMMSPTSVKSGCEEHAGCVLNDTEACS